MSASVLSVPWMPERAWTTCVSGGAISGLARSNYVPFAPQPYPPGMTAAEYAALDPAPIPGFGVPPPLDCFPRYVMWREQRRPDFEGGELPIVWTRSPGWQFRNDCVVPEPTVIQLTMTFYCGSLSSENQDLSGGLFAVYLDGSPDPFWVGSYEDTPEVIQIPAATASVRVVAQSNNPSCGTADQTDPIPPGLSDYMMDVVLIAV